MSHNLSSALQSIVTTINIHIIRVSYITPIALHIYDSRLEEIMWGILIADSGNNEEYYKNNL